MVRFYRENDPRRGRDAGRGFYDRGRLVQGEGRPQGAPAQLGLGDRRPPYTARSAVVLRAFFPGTGWTRGSVAESVLAAKRSTPPQYQGTGRSRLLYREEDE